MSRSVDRGSHRYLDRGHGRMARVLWLTAAVVVMAGSSVASVAARPSSSAPRYRIVRPAIVNFSTEGATGQVSFLVVLRLNRQLPHNRQQFLASIHLGTAHSHRPPAHGSAQALGVLGRPSRHCYEANPINIAVPRQLRHPKVGQAVTVELSVDGSAGGKQLVLAPTRVTPAETRSFPTLRYAQRLGC